MNNLQQQLERLNQRKEMKPLVLLSAFCMLLLISRMIKLQRIEYIFLTWNLFLAWVPWLISKYLQQRNDPASLLRLPKEIAGAWQKLSFLALSCTWLLFFPNAPYLISDLVHLNRGITPIAWFDAVMLFSFGLAGLYIGLASLRLMAEVWKRVFSVRIYQGISLIVFGLAGLGVYMGRDLRFNSWELFTNPYYLLEETLLQLDLHGCYMSALYAGLIGISYWVFQADKAIEA